MGSTNDAEGKYGGNLRNAIFGEPSIQTSSITSKGGIYNQNFVGSGSATASGWINSEAYKWYLYSTITSGTANYLTNGGISLTITTTGGDSRYFNIDSTANITPATAQLSNKNIHFIPLDIGGTYRFSIEYEVSGNSGGNLQAIFQEQDLGANNSNHTLTISGNNSRQFKIIEFTATYGYGKIMAGYLSGTAPTDGTVMKIYSVKLEKVISSTANTLTYPTESLTGIKAITSTSIVGPANDPSGLTTGSGVTFGGDGTTIGTKVAQRFTATSNRISGLSFKKYYNVGTPTGDIVISIHPDNGSNLPDDTKILACNYLTNAQWNAITDFTFYKVNLSCILTPGTNYWIIFEGSGGNASNYRELPVSNGTYGTSGDLLRYVSSARTSSGYATWDIAFLVHQSNNTNGINVKEHGKQFKLDFDAEGILNGTAIDAINGTYDYNSGFDGTSTSLLTASKDFLSATNAGMSSGSYIGAINGFRVDNSANYGYFATAAASAVMKITLPGNGKQLIINWTSYASSASIRNLQISYDNTNRTTITSHTVVGTSVQSTNIYDIPGQKTIYIKFDLSASAWFVVNSINATFDTSELQILENYPTGQDLYFAIPKILSVSASKVYYYESKYGSPALEYQDASGNILDYVILPIDTTGATGSSTLTYIKLGEGTAYTQIGDGSYITLGSATMKPVIYCNIKIDKNRTLISQNDNANTLYMGSLQGQTILQTETKGIVYEMQDIRDEINKIKSKI